MKLSAPPGLSIVELLALWRARRFNFYDEFNRVAVDTDIWTLTLDGGGTWTYDRVTLGPTRWLLKTGNVIDDDAALDGETVGNKGFSINEEGYTTVTWELRMKLRSIVDISSFWGLFWDVYAGYEEPVGECLHFFADPAITNTFRVRTYETAEEETDTLVPLDTDWHKFKMIWKTATVRFFIDDVLVATHATQVPEDPKLNEILLRTEAAAAKYMDIDYLRVELS